MTLVQFNIGDVNCRINLDNLREAVDNSAARVLTGMNVVVIITKSDISVLFGQQQYVAELVKEAALEANPYKVNDSDESR